MTDVYSSDYWQSEFTVTEADLNRLEEYIDKTGQAQDLTRLAKRIIRGRLMYGVDLSRAAVGVQANRANRSVRLWDPAGEWHIGDYVIVSANIWRDKQWWHVPYVGEIVAITPTQAQVRIDALNETRTYGISASEKELKKWRQYVEELVAARQNSADVETSSERILLEHGGRIVSQLLNALRADERFIHLAGCWFLRRLAVLPAETQLTALAWAMLKQAEPQPTDTLLLLLSPPVVSGDPGLFGLYLALRDCPELFSNATPGQRPRWQLVGPPPGPTVARYAAYDPANYHVLCEPGEPVGSEKARRLWELDLFKVVCAPAG